MSVKFKKALCAGLMFSLCSFGFSGCRGEGEKEIVTVKEETKAFYNLTEVEQRDVIFSKKLSLRFSSKATENLSFKVDGYRIKEIYVKQGDKVKKGDLLAELDLEEASDALETSEANTAEYELSLRFLTERKALEMSQAERMLASGECDEAGYKAMLQTISDTYDGEIKKFEDAIYYESLRIEYYGEKVEAGKIYAGIDGTAAYVRNYSPSYRSISSQNAITIYDSDRCIFTSNEIEYAPYLEGGKQYTITLLSGQLCDTVYNLSEDGKSLEFELLEPNYKLTSTSKASFYLEMNRAKDAAAVSKRAVHTAGDRDYVYYLDENNIRSVQYVEVGLRGDDYYEIISGVKVGDKVVLK